MPRALVTFEVYPEHGDMFELAATSRDVAAWEKQGKGRSLQKLQSEPSMADLELVAWFALEREVRAGSRTYPDGITDVLTFRSNCDVFPTQGGDLDPT
jgi:hypothetical protein